MGSSAEKTDVTENSPNSESAEISNKDEHLIVNGLGGFTPTEQSLNTETTGHDINGNLKAVESNEPTDKVIVPEMSQRRIMKNVLVIGIMFFLQYVAYGGLEGLQSSLHREQGVGVITQAILAGVATVSSLFLPKLVTELLGYKWCMCLSFLVMDLWMAANGYAIWATMIPASILVGIVATPLWTAQGCYLTLAARQYATLSGQDPHAVTAQFFGIFFAFYRLNGVLGSIIASTILSNRPENVTSPTDELLQSQCGLNDCPGSNMTNSNMDKPSSAIVWILVGVLLGVAAVAFVIGVVFLDPMPTSWLALNDKQQPDDEDPDSRRKCPPSRRQCRTVWRSLTATIRHMKNVPQLLLIPLTMYSTIELTFYRAEYAKSFVACFLGIWMVGWTKIPHAVVNTVTSLIAGRLARQTGIYSLFIAGGCFELVFQLTLMFWMPVTSQAVLFYVIPCFNAVGEGIIKVQLTSVYATIFPNDTEAAFSNLRFWESIGFLISWGYSGELCTEIKLYILTSFLLVGLSMVLLIYVFYVRDSRNKVTDVNKDVVVVEEETKQETGF